MSIPREVIDVLLRAIGILGGGIGIAFTLFLLPVYFGDAVAGWFSGLVSKLT